MTAIYTIAAVVALVWYAVYALRGSLVAGCLVFVLAGACLGHCFWHFDVAGLPLTLDRVVLLLLVPAYFVQRLLGRAEPKTLTRADQLLMAFMGVLLASAVASNWQLAWRDQTAALFRLTTGYLMPLAVYWIARQSRLDRRQLSIIYGTLAGFAVYLAVTAILEMTGQWWAVFPSHIADPRVGLHFGRARGPMVHAVSLGTYLVVGLFAVWAWRTHWNRTGRLVLLAIVPLLLAAICFTYTRSVWMGTALGTLVVLGFSLRGRWRPLVLGGLVTAGLLLTVTRIDELMSFRRDSTATDTRRSVDLRGSFAYISWQMFLDRPLCGVGFNQFFKAKLPYLSDRSTPLYLEITREYVHHNTLLCILTETGLIGLALFLGTLAGWGRTAWRLARRADLPDWVRIQGVFFLSVLGLYLCQAVFHELSYMIIDNVVVFFLGGVTMGLVPWLRTAENAQPDAAAAPRRRLWPRLSLFPSS